MTRKQRTLQVFQTHSPCFLSYLAAFLLAEVRVGVTVLSDVLVVLAVTGTMLITRDEIEAQSKNYKDKMNEIFARSGSYARTTSTEIGIFAKDTIR